MSHLYDQSPLGKGFSLDLFGRLKVSEPYTLFDSTHRYSQDGDFDDVILGTGSTVGFITHQSTATLGIGTTAGCSIIRESKRIFSYQPGKALQVFQTFVMNSPKRNLTQRVGYGSSENGVFLEQATSSSGITTVFWLMRTSKSGIVTEIRIPQNEWNVDKFDGTGITGHNLDLSKVQLMFTEYEWLGVGAVRCGFAHEEGNFHIAHRFEHANIIDSVYMTTASLPVRYEILNTGVTTSASTLKQICISVQSNGGYEKVVAQNVARRDTFKVGIGTTSSFTPLVSIRLKPGREDSIVIPSQFNVIVSSQQESAWEVALIKNPVLSGAAFTSSDSPNVEYDISSTEMTGGVTFNNDYITSANKAFVSINQDEKYNFDLQLGRTQSKVSDIFTLGIKKLSGSDGNVIGSLNFYDLT